MRGNPLPSRYEPKKSHVIQGQKVLMEAELRTHEEIITTDLGGLTYLALREKCPNREFFLARIFPHSDRIRRDTYVSVFSPNAEKYGLEKIPYLDTFHAG